jgi:hypothetical protein
MTTVTNESSASASTFEPGDDTGAVPYKKRWATRVGGPSRDQSAAPEICWGSSSWGQPGLNVHVSSTGSHLDAEQPQP